jgi:hypothetical protein
MDISATLHRSLLGKSNEEMKTKLLAFCFIGAACAILTSCASGPAVSVQTDYNHQISFADYNTYSLDLNQAPALRPTGRAALSDALKASLAERGITEASAGKADLLVVPAASANERLHTMPSGTTTYVPYHGGHYGTGQWYMNQDVTQWTEGTLVLDFLDRKRHLVVFRGVGKGALSTAESNAAAIRKAVQKIVADIPH